MTAVVDSLFIGVAVVYLVATMLLFVFGTNLIMMSVTVWRRGRIDVPDSPPISPRPHDDQRPLDELLRAEQDSEQLPRVTVQLPIYNELYVSERIIQSACALDYPRHLLQIQVLDDSTDETSVVIGQAVERAKADGVDIVHVQRTNRVGYKAGALAEGLDSATGEFVAIFDADFVIPSDFLQRTVGYFAQADLAFVQARWGHLNRDYSWLTRLQSLAIDGHFLVEQAGRGERGYWFNFNGTAGIWRVEAIADAGGWTADTLTEDLDLSYRAHLLGWRGQYVEDLVVLGEVPAQLPSFRRQQHRWARGSIECATRLLPQVWRSDATPATKFQASIHLLSYGIHLLLLLLTLLYPLVNEAAVRYDGVSTLFGAGYLFAITALAPGIFFLVGQRQAGRGWIRQVPRIMVVIIFGSGLMLNTARAAIEIFTKRNPEFERTAKFGIDEDNDDPTLWSKKRYQLDVDRIVLLEFALGIYSLWSATLAYRHGNWGIMIYASIFGAGLLALCAVAMHHSIAIYRHRNERAATVQAERAALEMAP